MKLCLVTLQTRTSAMPRRPRSSAGGPPRSVRIVAFPNVLQRRQWDIDTAVIAVRVLFNE